MGRTIASPSRITLFNYSNDLLGSHDTDVRSGQRTKGSATQPLVIVSRY